MPGSFTFRDTFTTESFLSQTSLTKGAGTGIDDDTLFSAQGGAFTFDKNAINVTSIALQAGQTLKLDVDFGAKNGINAIDTELWVVDAFGKLAASNDVSSADAGSANANDAKLDFTAAAHGLYFIVVTQRNNDYIDGTFGFDNGGSDTGVFQLNMGLAGLPALTSGTSGNDSLTLTAADRRYGAGDGDDAISAADIRSIIDGGAGDDSLYGQSKADILHGGDGGDYLSGYTGNDVLTGGEDSDNLSGGAGADQLFGGGDSDYLNGDDQDDSLWGERGSDNLSGGAGNDTLDGGRGGDYIYHDEGNDICIGGAGRDTYYAYSSATALKINLALTGKQDTGAGLDMLSGIEDVTGSNGYGDTIQGNGAGNSIFGQGGDDYIWGQGGQDNLYGGLGVDRLRGGTGEDYLVGDTGDDVLFGDAGTDSLRGGAGADKLTGGAGGDSFYFDNAAESTQAEQDTIADFSQADGDRINLGQVFPGVLEFRGGGAFLNTGGEVRSADLGAYQRVFVNLDTDVDAEMVIRVNTPGPLVAGDFYL